MGRRIGSAALVADRLHARTDGLTSLAVLFSAGGVAIGYPPADPVVGLLITVVILAVLSTAARAVVRRLMDGVDPKLVDTARSHYADQLTASAHTDDPTFGDPHDVTDEPTLFFAEIHCTAGPSEDF